MDQVLVASEFQKVVGNYKQINVPTIS